ncbi:MAG: transketolase [Anaerolineae bacterium]|nr:transketolase [Anaerolineae bacterium]
MNYLTENRIIELESIARQLRIESLEMIYRRQSGHPGGALSAAEILAVLFFHKLRLDPQNSHWQGRDRFFLSKGHASAILYAALAKRGFFPREELTSWGRLDCSLQGHPDRLKTPGVEMSAGPLGHGLAVATGVAMGLRLDSRTCRVYVLLGDGEMQAGIVWEAASVAAKYRLANLTAILDYNDVQLDGAVHEIMPLEPVAERWRSFGWKVLEVNGHNVRQVAEALDLAEEIHHCPTMIIAHTTKGKGVSFMENDAKWHGAVPNQQQYEQAVTELLGKEG